MAGRSARWAKLADPTFDFDAGFKRFTDGFKIATNSKASIRGSRSRRAGGALHRRNRHQLLLRGA